MSAVMAVPLGELLKPTRSRVKPSDWPELPYIGLEHIEPHSMKLLGTVRASTMKSSAVHFMAGDVLYGRLRPYLNKVYRPTFEGLCSAEFIVLPPTDQIDGRYLQYFLNSPAFVRFASQQNSGDRPRVDFDQLATQEIPLPDKYEQQRIAAYCEKQFSRLDDVVKSLRRIQLNLRRYESCLLLSAMSSVNRRYKTVAVEDVGDILLGRRRAPEYVASAYERKYLRVANIKDDAIDFSDLETMRWDERHIARYELASGDILVSEGQSPERLGQSAIFRGHPQALCFQSTLHRFRADTRFTTPEFAQLVFRSHVRSGAFRRLGSITTNIAHLTLEKFKAAPFPLPPQTEQRRIVAEIDRRVSIVREVEASLEANLKRARALKNGVLERAYQVPSKSERCQ